MGRRRDLERILASEYVGMSELVQLSGVRYSTIKYYTEEGLLPFEQEDTRMARKYPQVQAIERLEEIRSMKEEQGLTIKEIKELLVHQSP